MPVLAEAPVLRSAWALVQVPVWAGVRALRSVWALAQVWDRVAVPPLLLVGVQAGFLV